VSSPSTAPPRPKTARIGLGPAVLIEVVAIAAAVGVGHLVAGLVAPLSSPFQAVADTVVRLSPDWLTEFGKSLDFPAVGLPAGVADKVLLLVGIAVALLVVGVLAGVAAHRSRSLGRAVIVGLGVAGLAAVVFSPVFGPISVLAPLAALLAGLSVYFRLYNLAEDAAGRPTPPATAAGPAEQPAGAPLHDQQEWRIDRAERCTDSNHDDHEWGRTVATPAPTDVEVTRRRLLVAAGGVGAGALVAGGAGQLLGAGSGPDAGDLDAVRERLRPARPAPPVPPGADFAAEGTPTFITANRDFYRIDTALRVPVIDTADYRLRVHGMVGRELNLTYDDLVRRPLEERIVTLACVSNVVNGDLISTAAFTGVSLRDLLLEAGVSPDAEQIFTTSDDGWTCGTPTSAVLEPDRGAMLALAMNGEPLPVEHGYPVRMVVPGLYGFVSATKWLTDLELTTFDRRRSYWLDRGWAREAPIKTQSRIDRPRGLNTVPAGRVTAAGIAWAQHRGVARVEVRVNAGPWREARLSEEVNRDSWRMWRVDLDLSPGEYFLESRATDAEGAVQTEVRTEPIPDGASGWPGIPFTVR
jgi:DMSO/TMAO reductase YedYZ molybdopterin-dependent catalytic subunit